MSMHDPERIEVLLASAAISSKALRELMDICCSILLSPEDRTRIEQWALPYLIALDLAEGKSERVQ
jgi:hypothetical protein